MEPQPLDPRLIEAASLRLSKIEIQTAPVYDQETVSQISSPRKSVPREHTDDVIDKVDDQNPTVPCASPESFSKFTASQSWI